MGQTVGNFRGEIEFECTLIMAFMACFTFYKFLVPINSPYNLASHNVSSRAINVSWDYNDNPRLVLGYLQGFVLYIMEANASDFFTDDAIIQSYHIDTRRSTIVNGLKIFRLYNISIAARTDKGVGPRSESVVVRTHGKGEWAYSQKAYTQPCTSIKVS